MNTAPKPKFHLSARYLGPIFSLDGELTKNAQNLIFARNGTGKSFLSRAFRYLDLFQQGVDISDAAFFLVSDESVNGTGEFSIHRGTNSMGALTLEKTGSKVGAKIDDSIFHVFSEDFVQSELRERQYKINDEIENVIAVDSDNIKLKDAQDELEKARDAFEKTYIELLENFENGKIDKLNNKAGLNKRLREYANLDLDKTLAQYSEKPTLSGQNFDQILRDLDSLKAIPAEPAYLPSLNLISSDDINLDTLKAALQKETSPSSVSADIKKKIDAHHDFYETGTRIVKQEHRTQCPFCEQGIKELEPKAIIDAYVEYFSDEEEKHKTELRFFFQKLNQKENELKEIEIQFVRQKSRFDELKRYVPSQKDVELSAWEGGLKKTYDAIVAIKSAIEQKVAALASPHSLSAGDLISGVAAINATIEDNNNKASDITRAIERADDERKSLQRKACSVFEREWVVDNWAAIEATRALQETAKTKQDELSALEKSSPSTNARDRVSETFELLLKEFFAGKYLFDRHRFVLKRGENEMVRGPHRTMSDGEKTAIAFCYFIASIHQKVSSNSDYEKLYLVFDDPVTSMSYDFIFSIAQTLKNLNISKQGEVSINPGKIDGNKSPRPNLLILTHSSYFFNISRTNAVVKPEATFSLHAEGLTHKLTHLQDYIAPFEQQLEHIYLVANGDDPDHSTGNAIRSVLEAIGRFCRPDKTQSIQDFITFLAGEEGISVKSILINSLCHGTYYDETPPPDDLKLACSETLEVVRKFAIGHLELIKSAVGTK